MVNFNLIKVAIILTPGVLNLIQAYYNFSEDSKIRGFPFFKPWRSLGFGLWLTLQIFFPSAIFYYFFQLQLSLQLDLMIWVKAVLFGESFVGIVNATTRLGPIIVNVKTAYDFFLIWAVKMIENEESSKSARFWSALEKELKNILNQNKKENILEGLDYLRFYFKEYNKNISINYIPRNKAAKKSRKSYNELIDEVTSVIQSVSSGNTPDYTAKKIIEIVQGNVKSRDLIDLLEKFGCNSVLDRDKRCLKLPSNVKK